MDAPDPTMVGNHFIVQYYTVLHKNPESLYNFYSERSECTYGYEDEEGKSAKGLKGIEDLIALNGYENCKVALSALDCQGSANGGIFVSVVGKLLNKDGNPQRFVQSFFLERLAAPAGSYFVLNDVCRFLKDEEEDEGDEQEEDEEDEEEEDIGVDEKPSPPHTTPAAAPSGAVVLEDHAPAEVPKLITDQSTPAATAAVSNAPTSSVQAGQTTPGATSLSATNAPAAVNAISNSTSTHAEKKGAQHETPSEKKSFSWASIVENSKDAPAPISNNITPNPVAAPVKSSATAKAAPAVNVSNSNNQGNQRERPAVQLPHRSRSSPMSPVLAEGCSIYASGVPTEATQEQVVAIFNQYGKVRHVVLKSAKQFAFVEYETPVAVQQALNAMKNNPPSVNGRLLIIEERKPRGTTVGGPSASPRGRGRGGGSRGGGPRTLSFGSGGNGKEFTGDNKNRRGVNTAPAQQQQQPQQQQQQQQPQQQQQQQTQQQPQQQRRSNNDNFPALPRNQQSRNPNNNINNSNNNTAVAFNNSTNNSNNSNNTGPRGPAQPKKT